MYMFSKIKNWIILILLSAVGLLSVMVTGRKTKFIKEKEKEVEKKQKEINVVNKDIDKGQEEVDNAEREARQAVKNYRELKKEHDKQIKKAGVDGNVKKARKFDDPNSAANYINGVLTHVSSSSEQQD